MFSTSAAHGIALEACSASGTGKSFSVCYQAVHDTVQKVGKTAKLAHVGPSSAAAGPSAKNKLGFGADCGCSDQNQFSFLNVAYPQEYGFRYYTGSDPSISVGLPSSGAHSIGMFGPGNTLTFEYCLPNSQLWIIIGTVTISCGCTCEKDIFGIRISCSTDCYLLSSTGNMWVGGDSPNFIASAGQAGSAFVQDYGACVAW